MDGGGSHTAMWMYLSPMNWRGFAGGSVVKNPPANVEDMGSIPDQGRSPTPWSSWACVPQLLSLCSRAWESPLLKPESPRAHALQQEKPPQREAQVLTARED